MILQSFRAQVAAGEGFAAHFGPAVLLAFPLGERQEALLDQILATVEAGAREDPNGPGRKVARRIVRVIGDAEPEDVPAVGVLAQTDGGVAVLLHGGVDLDLEGPVEVEHLSGRDVSTWLDRIVADGPQTLRRHGGAGAPEPDRRSDLRAGIVSSGGIVLTPRPDGPVVGDAAMAAAATGVAAAGSGVDTPRPIPPPPVPEPGVDEATELVPEATPPPPPPPPGAEPEPVTPAADFVSFSVAEPLPPEDLAPLPVAGETEAPAEEEADGVEVRGILCSRQHFNDPRSAFCTSCGISMVHQTHNLLKGKRPPLGVLLSDDGSAFVLDTDYVIGREPEGHPDVAGGAARPLILEDQQFALSRQHVRVQLQDWDVRVLDLGSANGSYVAAADAGQWTLLAPEQPVTLDPGGRLHVAGRNFVYESHHRH
ncbi:hypothetical protein BH24ACT3_BH24ACT3_09190 [soil metagenome]